jgi:glucose-1-phosphate thymidylyltransferase
MYPLTQRIPKPLLKINNKPVITYLVKKVPPDIDIVVSTNKRYEADFLEWQKGLSRGVDIFIEDVFGEKDKPGAISSIDLFIRSKNVSDDLLIIAGDNYFNFSLPDFIKTYNGRNALVAIHDIGDTAKAREFGVVKLEGNRIVELREKPAQPSSSLIATACYIFPSRIFGLLAEYCADKMRDNLGVFISYLLEREEVQAYVFDEEWFDIGSLDPLERKRLNI